MLKLLSYSICQCLLLVGGQVFLKFAMMNMPKFGWTKTFWLGLLTNWQFAVSGLLFGGGSLLWMFIIKKYPFSMAYPMISLSYVFGMFAAALFFHEALSYTKWMGVACIILGCILIAK